MRTIEVEDGKFTCPMMNMEVSSNIDKAPNFVTCAMCKMNILGQMINDTENEKLLIYCNF